MRYVAILLLALGFPVVTQAQQSQGAKLDPYELARTLSHCGAVYDMMSEVMSDTPATSQQMLDTGRGAKAAGAWLLYIAQKKPTKTLAWYMDTVDEWAAADLTIMQSGLELAMKNGTFSNWQKPMDTDLKMCLGMLDVQKELIDQGRRSMTE